MFLLFNVTALDFSWSKMTASTENKSCFNGNVSVSLRIRLCSMSISPVSVTGVERCRFSFAQKLIRSLRNFPLYRGSGTGCPPI